MASDQAPPPRFLFPVQCCAVLVPGVYQSVQLWGALRGWRGYRLESTPSFEPDSHWALI
jgi:hypothetical protein